MIHIADLHCDSLTYAYDNSFALDDSRLHLSPARIPQGYRWLQVMAIFVPDHLRGPAAREYFESVYRFYLEHIRTHPGQITPIDNLCKTKISMREQGRFFNSILSVEGGSVLEGNPANVNALYEKGVRLLTLTWNGANELCGGVMSGGGFTAAGREVVRRMEAFGMIVDVSHISDEGFYELCGFAEKPFIASHSNARDICPHPRNITNQMFREIVRRRGLVGLNYYDRFILDGGGSAAIDDLLRHVYHFLELGGEDVLALGSDFDGADVPDYLSGADKIPDFISALYRSGIPGDTITKILSQNVMRFFAENGGCS